jgi:hypothetical protein
MAPVSLIVDRQQKVDFAPTTSSVGLGEKLVRICGSVNYRAMDCVRNPFSRKQWPCSTLLTIMRKVAMRGPCEIRMVEGHCDIPPLSRDGQS